jgi:hypothetical protein
MSDYDGPATIVTSAGDSFAECHLVASATDDGWTGTLTDILWRTQMVAQPLRDQEHLRIDGLEDKPQVTITVGDQAYGTAEVGGTDPLFR